MQSDRPGYSLLGPRKTGGLQIVRIGCVRRTMQLRNSFDVEATIADAWDMLLDVEQIAPCVPGATLTRQIDAETWEGEVAVKIGPVSVAYHGTLKIETADSEQRTIVLAVDARETRSRGIAKAKIESHLEPTGERTRVTMISDVLVTGPVAQYGGPVLGDVSQQLADEFARCLSAQLAATVPNVLTGATGPPPAVRPIGGLRLVLRAVLRSIGRGLMRLWRSVSDWLRRGK